MDLEKKYAIDREILFKELEVIDLPKIIAASTKDWQNFSLCAVNDCVVRIGIIHGDFHWHKHVDEDEFFYVLEGLLHIDIGDSHHTLQPGQGFVVPRGIEHRTRAPERTVILMVEGSGVKPTGD